MAVEKRNILLTNITEAMKYKGRGGRGNSNIPQRERMSHAINISNDYENFLNEALIEKETAKIKSNGKYAEFSGQKGYDLSTKSLENRTSGIRLLNVKTVNECTKATVYIPEGKEDFFRKRIMAYANEETKKGKAKHAELINSIEKIKLAGLESFWTDKTEKIPTRIPRKCEIWLRYEFDKAESEAWKSTEDEFHRICDMLNIVVNKSQRLIFPERIVKIVTADEQDLKNLLISFEYISEIQSVTEPTNFYTGLCVEEQKEWTDEFISRCTFNDTGVSVCLLDAGINDQHPLLIPAIQTNGLHVIDSEWGTYDSPNYRGHGTEMAGVILYDDLQKTIESCDSVCINHKIESVKILPNCGKNPSDLYGALTQDAVSYAEISNPSNNRIICMAVTAKAATDDSDDVGKPTSWSAAVDEITVGTMEKDGESHRLFLVSAGNVDINVFSEGVNYPDGNSLEMIHNPGQSWNAITIGGYSGKIDIEEGEFDGFSALAEKGALSPYSTTSALWSNRWPVKPEVLFNAGNIITNGSDYSNCPDLELLTTNYKPEKNIFSTICATSAATAQAANFSAKLCAEYPNLWPETIRALMIHSADWTDVMRRQFCPIEKDINKSIRRNLLRNCGYGIPNLQRAIQCVDNSVNMIVQSEIQPYKKENGSVKMNEMHIHEFPWPRDVLLELGEVQTKLKVTLSYFIEPSPGEVGWTNRYKYPSCGLRFEVKNADQTLDDFKGKVNLLARDEDGSREYHSQTTKWYLGPKNRDVGSIHSDYLIESAANLSEMEYVAIYPVGGWWKDRTYLGKSESKVRYSLVITISTEETEVDLYTPIINQIENRIPVAIPVV